MYKVKICGIREERHIQAAIESGAAYIGLVFFQKSIRNVSIESAQALASNVPARVKTVALVVNPCDEVILKILQNVQIDMFQLHGNETVERVQQIKDISRLPVIKAIGVSSKKDLHKVRIYETVADLILLDGKPPSDAPVPGGLGKSFNWRILSEFKFRKPWLLAGGLNEENVRLAAHKTNATQFDVSSGVEDNTGRKSEKKIFRFIEALKGNLNE